MLAAGWANSSAQHDALLLCPEHVSPQPGWLPVMQSDPQMKRRSLQTRNACSLLRLPTRPSKPCCLHSWVSKLMLAPDALVSMFTSASGAISTIKRGTTLGASCTSRAPLSCTCTICRRSGTNCVASVRDDLKTGCRTLAPFGCHTRMHTALWSTDHFQSTMETKCSSLQSMGRGRAASW